MGILNLLYLVVMWHGTACELWLCFTLLLNSYVILVHFEDKFNCDNMQSLWS